MREGYSVTIATTSRELTAKERIFVKNYGTAQKLDDLTKDGAPFVIENPEAYAVLEIHNDSADNTDYKVIVIIDGNGRRYSTGSNSFIESFVDIFDEMAQYSDGEPYSVEVLKMPSRNYKGKHFMTASII